MLADFNQWSTAKPLLSAGASWIADETEALRIGSYQLYEQIYWNVPETFKLVSRGQDSLPIYIPAAKTIVEALHRHLAKDFLVSPNPAYGTPNAIALGTQVVDDLFARERFYSRFSTNKRYGIIRGDWLWHLRADPEREPGSKISIEVVDPASWFPIYNDENVDEMIGVHIVEPYLTNDGKTLIRRQTYRKATGKGGPSPITSEEAIYKVDAWGGPGMEQDPIPEIVVQTPVTLPSPIDSLPIYGMRNFEEPGSVYGSSELRGFERILAAVNQSITDEELALAMDGLGVYATTAGAPLDEDTGQEMPWDLGPARVVEHPEGTDFKRVSGVGSVQPLQEHLKYLHDQINEATGSPTVARGVVDVSVAESGIALAIQMGPMDARVGEKNLGIRDVTRNMMFDLGKWYVAYEGTAFSPLLELRWQCGFGTTLPKNVEAEVERIVSLVQAKLISAETGRERLRELGVVIPEESVEAGRLSGEAQSEADAFGARIEGELNNVDTGDQGDGDGAVTE